MAASGRKETGEGLGHDGGDYAALRRAVSRAVSLQSASANLF